MVLVDGLMGLGAGVLGRWLCLFLGLPFEESGVGFFVFGLGIFPATGVEVGGGEGDVLAALFGPLLAAGLPTECEEDGGQGRTGALPGAEGGGFGFFAGIGVPEFGEVVGGWTGKCGLG